MFSGELDMRKLYKQNDANFPRLESDKFYIDHQNEYRFSGIIDDSIRFVENFQLLDEKLWSLFVHQFEYDSDGTDNGWRGEYWGKMMRGACFVYSYTKNPHLYNTLKKAVEKIIDTADKDGRISSYSKEKEFGGWDMWSRKYVLLGLEYFLEICDEKDLSDKVINSMCKQLDYIIENIGDEKQWKKHLANPSVSWKGMNSASILEPVVRLYNITQNSKYLEFAKIITENPTAIVNVFELAYQNKLYPYQYPLTKAYEMISCFEGLLEYYRVTKNQEYKIALINFADRILESDFTIIGSCGCTHELFDHSTVRQANTTNYWVMQETCVTVTLMKFMFQMTLLTGNSTYVDAFETSFYNAYLGAINTDKVISNKFKEVYPLCKPKIIPFDSYSPLTAGTRGNAVGGLKIISEDGDFYGCCMCIGAAGIGMLPKMSILSAENGFVLNMFVSGTVKTVSPQENSVVFETQTQYPANQDVKTIIRLEKSEKFSLYIRNPFWSKNTLIKVNGVKVNVNEGYIEISRNWQDGDTVEIQLDMRTRPLYPIPYGHDILMNKVIYSPFYLVSRYDEEDPLAKSHIALKRGPLVLAQDNRLGYNVENPVSIKISSDGFVESLVVNDNHKSYRNMVELAIPLENGEYMHVTDYASAGKTWSEESKMAAWILTK